MIEIIAYIAFGFLLIRMGVGLLNLLSSTGLKEDEPDALPSVSILIPARNEEKSLPVLLRQIGSLDYPDFEVMVYDDESTDGTLKMLEEAAKKYKWLTVIKGIGLPEGWLGKNHACHRLAEKSEGEYLLFLDADVHIEPSVIKDSLSSMIKSKVEFLSVFPRQMMRSFGEWLTVPVMNQILVSLLPLYLVRHSSWKDFAAANGQFMLFKGDNYRKHRYHELFRNDPVEDIKIMREMKRLGYPVKTYLSNGQVSCRMYHSFNEAVTGFSKNVIEFFGGRLVLILLYLFLTNFGFVFIFLGLPLYSLMLYLGLSLILKGLTSWVSRQKILPNLLLLPLQQISLNIIVFSAIRKRLSGSMRWKERNIRIVS